MAEECIAGIKRNQKLNKTGYNIVYAIMLPKRSHYAYTGRWAQYVNDR